MDGVNLNKYLDDSRRLVEEVSLMRSTITFMTHMYTEYYNRCAKLEKQRRIERGSLAASSTLDIVAELVRRLLKWKH